MSVNTFRDKPTLFMLMEDQQKKFNKLLRHVYPRLSSTVKLESYSRLSANSFLFNAFVMLQFVYVCFPDS